MALVCEHHETLETDLLPEHDLLDVWRGAMSFRRLELLIRNLPAGSATVRAIDPDAAELNSWRTGDYLQAYAIDLFGQANFKNWTPFPRPDDVIRERKRRDARHAALERQAERAKQGRR